MLNNNNEQAPMSPYALSASIMLNQAGQGGTASVLFTKTNYTTGHTWSKEFVIECLSGSLRVDGLKLSTDGEQVTRSRLWRSIVSSAAKQDELDGPLHGEVLLARIEGAIAHRYEEFEVDLLSVVTKNNIMKFSLRPETVAIYRRPNLLEKHGVKVVKIVDKAALEEARLSSVELTADKVAGLNIGRLAAIPELSGAIKAVYKGWKVVGADFDAGLVYLIEGDLDMTPNQAQKFFKRLLKRPGVAFAKRVKVVYMDTSESELVGELGFILDGYELAESINFLTTAFQSTVDVDGIAGKGVFFAPHSPIQLGICKKARAYCRDAALVVNTAELGKFLGAGVVPAEGTVAYLEEGDITLMDSLDGDSMTKAGFTATTLIKHASDEELTGQVLKLWAAQALAGFKAMTSGDVAELIKADVLPSFGVYKALAGLKLKGIPEELYVKVAKQFVAWAARMSGAIYLKAFRRYMGAATWLKADEMLVPRSLAKWYPMQSVCCVLSHPTQSDLTYGKFRVVGFVEAEVFAFNPETLKRLRRDNDGDQASVFLPGELQLSKTHAPSYALTVLKKDKSKAAAAWSPRAIYKIAEQEQALVGLATNLITNAHIDAIVQDKVEAFDVSKVHLWDHLQAILDSMKHIVELGIEDLKAALRDIRETHGFGTDSTDEYCSAFKDLNLRTHAKEWSEELSCALVRSNPVTARFDAYLLKLMDAWERTTPNMLDGDELKDALGAAITQIQMTVEAVIGEARYDSELAHIVHYAERAWSMQAETAKAAAAATEAGTKSTELWELHYDKLTQYCHEVGLKLVSPLARQLFIAKAAKQKRGGISVTFLAIIADAMGESDFIAAAIADSYEAVADGTVVLTCEAHEVINVTLQGKAMTELRKEDANLPKFMECVIKPVPADVIARLPEGSTLATNGLAVMYKGVAVALVYPDKAKFLKIGRKVTLDRWNKTLKAD
jgi:hypothetical protein